MELLKEIIEEIKPEKKDERINEFLEELQLRIDKKKVSAKVFLGGSFAKGTYLKDNYDIDIFIRFDKKYLKEDLSKLLESCLKGLKYEMVHGSRDYFQINNEFKFEIVPVLEINKPEDAVNVTDMSPLHVNWVLKNGKDLKEDIILLKQFCKACKVYGAESYIKGFSGHVVDILVINYDGFLNVLKASLKWKKKEIIDYHNHHKGDALWNLNKSKLQSPLIVIDPILHSRNAAAALSKEKLDVFVSCAKRFLKKPSKYFFIVKEFDSENYKGLVLEFESVKGKEDVVGAKVLKAFEFIVKGLDEFVVVDSGWEWSETNNKMWFKVKDNEIEEEYERIGPPVNRVEDVDKFKLKHNDTYVKSGKVCCKIKRKYFKVEDKIKSLVKDKYVTERLKCIQLLKL